MKYEITAIVDSKPTNPLEITVPENNTLMRVLVAIPAG